MTAVFKRELFAMLHTVTGWLYIAATIALFGLFTYAINFTYGDPLLSNTLGSISYLMLITVPVLTMRTLSEERRSKTDQLLLTSPLPVGRMVLAKYLALAVIHSAAVLIMCVAPLIILGSGGGTGPQNFVSLLGFWLYGMGCLAIGLFVSALSESQVIAAVLTFVFLFLGYLMSSITQLITDTGFLGTAVKALLGSYDLTTPLNTFFDGCVSLTGVIYYVSISALFVFLATQVIQKRRWTVSTKKLSLSAFSAGFTGMAVALAVFVNLAANELPSTISQIDVTAAQLYSLTDTTTAYLGTLDKDVKIYVIGQEASVDTTVKQTLQKYADSSDHIDVEYNDPYANPTFYQQFTSDQISYGSLIVVCGERSKVIDYSSLFESEIDYDTYQSTVTGYDGEGQIDSAIQYVTSETLPALYALEGHGETALSGNFSAAVEKANATLTTISLLTTDIPEDAQAVIVNGPTSDLSSDDADKLISYLNGGGTLLVTLNYEAGQLPNLGKVLAEFEVTQLPGLVFENDQSMFYQQQYYLLPTVEYSDYTKSISNQRVFLPLSQGLGHADASETVTYTSILTTSDSAVAKADLNNVTTTEFVEGDTRGPLDVALAATKTVSDKTATLLAFGGFQMFTDSADEVVSGANLTLFTDTLATLSSDGESPAAIVVPAKAYDTSRVTMDAMAALLWGALLLAVIPLACLAAGVLIWYRRRKS
ncbi:MAG: Gldg family protein [Propionibacteriaceae bacterium]|jgi:ABC-2 type transport system permease protein|nr:Gldg family protein [Propionibacteriaceae bacterium]